jgi:prepilin-type N-terminal cleavage/methylation domain-containing protein
VRREHYYRAKSYHRQAAYSLLELSVVVLILGIVAAILVPDSTPTNQHKLDLAAQEFAAAMRFARSEAIRLGEPRGFRQESMQMRIRVFRPDIGTNPWTPIYDVYHPVSKKLYDIDLNTHPLASVDSITHSRVYRGSCNQAGIVYFDGQGIPRCTDPETVLLEQFELTFTLGNTSRLLRLDGISGQVNVQ